MPPSSHSARPHHRRSTDRPKIGRPVRLPQLLLSTPLPHATPTQVGMYRAYKWEPKVSAVMARAARVLAGTLQQLPRYETTAVETAITYRLTVDGGVAMEGATFAAKVTALTLVFPLDVRLLAVEVRGRLRQMKRGEA